ncbi:MAG: FAD-dependent oxidoreductase [Salinicola sp.]|uniref:NAD(P)/FAD-dependent oxidoreductase n=1 Tax=uncultured Salinicola sp. TaxID=1193542 RepID=UPI000C91EF75|nr:FAD-dependent oxidoreductase [uncultured Salinicola sp.]MAM58968.1 FAD-dependent oxidoreductase [Salinicola sp.]
MSQSDHSTAPLTIVGTGMAGVGLARAIRGRDGERPITLISADSGDEYTKPLLSSAFAKRQTAQSLVMRDAVGLAATLRARVRTHTTVDAIDTARRRLRIGAELLPYGQLVLATGAAPWQPFEVASSLRHRVFQINDLDGYRRLRGVLDRHPGRQARIAIIGAGLVGCEFANDLHAGGHRVALIAPEATPLPRLLPPPLGRALGEAFAEAGIRGYFERQVSALHDDGEGVTLVLDDGEALAADLVLVATGLRPRTALAEVAGLAVSPAGILTDRRLATSAPNVFALGDVACVDGLDAPVGGLSAMYVQPLQAAVKALAATLAGIPTEVSYGAWPVVVKTPLLPVVALPPREPPHRWRIEGEASDFSALAEDESGRLLGFALTGRCVRRKVELARAAPPLLG